MYLGRYWVEGRVKLCPCLHKQGSIANPVSGCKDLCCTSTELHKIHDAYCLWCYIFRKWNQQFLWFRRNCFWFLFRIHTLLQFSLQYFFLFKKVICNYFGAAVYWEFNYQQFCWFSFTYNKILAQFCVVQIVAKIMV